MIKSLFLRAVRSSVATAIGGWLAGMRIDDPDSIWLALVPTLVTFGKFLRLRFPKIAEWLPVL